MKNGKNLKIYKTDKNGKKKDDVEIILDEMTNRLKQIGFTTTEVTEEMSTATLHAKHFENILTDSVNKAKRHLAILQVKSFTVGLTFNERQRLNDLKSGLLFTYYN